MPVTNPPLLSGDQINAQHSKAWNRKTFPHTGGQNPWHLPDCVVWPHFPLRVLALPNEFFKAAETWWLLKECCPLADSVPGLHFLRKPAVETQFLLARISTFVYLNHFSYLAFLQSSLKGRDKQENLSSGNDTVLLGSLVLWVTVWHLATM